MRRYCNAATLLEFDINFDNSSAVDLSPVLVTCHRKAGANGRGMSAFDAQIFPYTLSEGRLHARFCLGLGGFKDDRAYHPSCPDCQVHD